jgi:beta-lactamase regulating signal transducer with metallopeptidase domain
MYALRGIAVSLSIFSILYLSLSIAVKLLWRRIAGFGPRNSARDHSNLLFALRMSPLFIATVATLAFTAPSFVMLEPRAVEESMGAAPLALAICGMAVVLAGIWKAGSALFVASRTVAHWSARAHLLTSSSNGSVPVLQTSTAAPPLTATGILHPRVWLSAAAEFLLTDRELQTALRHEVVHVRRRDNLRKLLLRFAALPGMAELEAAWREATEMAADDAAVSNAAEALDLAAAVIKLARIAPSRPLLELTTALVHSPAESVNARVQRLMEWTEPPQISASRYSWHYTLAAAATLLTLVVTYSHLLMSVHEATEWLVR